MKNIALLSAGGFGANDPQKSSNLYQKTAQQQNVGKLLPFEFLKLVAPVKLVLA